MKKKISPEDKLTARLTETLAKDITKVERVIINDANEQLFKSVYFPKIVADLQAKLIYLAIKHELSKAGSELYLDLIKPEYFSARSGGGLGYIFHSLFGGF